MLNKVTKAEVIEAIEFWFVQGFIEELTSDKKYYITILLKKVANDYNIELDFEELS